MEWVGWCSAIALGICAVPQAVKTLRTGRADDLSWIFLLSWFLGELLGVVYIWPKGHIPLLCNYIFNAAILTPIIYIKAREVYRGKSSP